MSSHKSSTMKVTKQAFYYTAYKDFTKETNYGNLWHPKKMPLRKFQALFRLTPHQCKVLWNRLDHYNPTMPFTQVSQLLYGLHYMATYCTFDNMSTRTGKDEKTLCKWTWIVIKFIAEQDWVRLTYYVCCCLIYHGTKHTDNLLHRSCSSITDTMGKQTCPRQWLHLQGNC
jgi:hypothetical protein